MATKQYQLTFATKERGLINITDKIVNEVNKAGIETGLCHVFLHHTSASLILCENADPLVLNDLESFFERLIQDNHGLYQHDTEGPDDMPAHIRTVLTGSFLMIPITSNKLALGTWQGIYLWEQRLSGHQRRVTITLLG